jgi:hypothetical protein
MFDVDKEETAHTLINHPYSVRFDTGLNSADDEQVQYCETRVEDRLSTR